MATVIAMVLLKNSIVYYVSLVNCMLITIAIIAPTDRKSGTSNVLLTDISCSKDAHNHEQLHYDDPSAPCYQNQNYTNMCNK